MSDDTLASIGVLSLFALIICVWWIIAIRYDERQEIIDNYKKQEYIIKFDIDEFVGPIRNGSNTNIFSVKNVEIYNSRQQIELTKQLIDKLNHTFLYKCNKLYSAGNYINKFDVNNIFKEKEIPIVIDYINNQTIVGPITYKNAAYFNEGSILMKRLPDCDTD